MTIYKSAADTDNHSCPLFSVQGVRKTFRNLKQQEQIILEGVTFAMYENEIVALLGKSGCGKSTLLRMIAGLIPPSSGSLYYRGEPIQGPVRGIAMVFQSFALMPWLSVLQNVELGLEAIGVPPKERRNRTLQAIDSIGLDGFESAYPKELSGGMQQRVGIARALVVESDLLLMDEPFSALDVLTAEHLRNDLMDLWLERRTKTKGILFVTHNIEEAVLIADRILILGSEPGSIRAELIVRLNHPRDSESAPFRQLVDQIYTLMTSAAVKAQNIRPRFLPFPKTPPPVQYQLPFAQTGEIIGLIETLADWGGPSTTVDLPEVAAFLHLNASDLFPLTEALEILHLAKISTGDIQLTAEGIQFAKAGILERKQLFAKQLSLWVPLAQYIRTILDERPTHRESEDFFINMLEKSMSSQDAERVLRTMIDWGRYAEFFAYDYDSGALSLENPR